MLDTDAFSDTDCAGCDRPIRCDAALVWDGQFYCDAACLDPGDRVSLDEDRNAQDAFEAARDARLDA